MTTLIICRHANTFDPGETPRRVGKNTDIPLSQTGLLQAEKLGIALAQEDFIPDVIVTSTLKRTRQTAKRACEVMNISQDIKTDTRLDEISYGPDENKLEEEVIARVGEEALNDWNMNAIPPPGWDGTPARIKEDWLELAQEFKNNFAEKKIMVVTSNGIGRFAPYITGNYEAFCRSYPIKLKTGAYSVFEYDGTDWQCMKWNVVPV